MTALAGLMAVLLLTGSTTACESSSKRKKRSKADRDDDRVTSQRATRPSPSSTSDRSPLRWAGETGKQTSQLSVGQTLYDGLAVVQNVSGSPLTLVSVTTAGQSPAVRVSTAGVVALSDRTAEKFGVVTSLPAGVKLTPLARTQVLPRQSSQTRYAIVFAVKAEKPGRWQAPAVLITYRDGDETRRFEIGYDLTVCVAPEATAEC